MKKTGLIIALNFVLAGFAQADEATPSAPALYECLRNTFIASNLLSIPAAKTEGKVGGIIFKLEGQRYVLSPDGSLFKAHPTEFEETELQLDNPGSPGLSYYLSPANRDWALQSDGRVSYRVSLSIRPKDRALKSSISFMRELEPGFLQGFDAYVAESQLDKKKEAKNLLTFAAHHHLKLEPVQWTDKFAAAVSHYFNQRVSDVNKRVEYYTVPPKNAEELRAPMYANHFKTYISQLEDLQNNTACLAFIDKKQVRAALDTNRDNDSRYKAKSDQYAKELGLDKPYREEQVYPDTSYRSKAGRVHAYGTSHVDLFFENAQGMGFISRHR